MQLGSKQFEKAERKSAIEALSKRFKCNIKLWKKMLQKGGKFVSLCLALSEQAFYWQI